AIQMSRRTSLRSCNAYAHYYLGRSLLIAEQSGLRLESNQYLEEALAEAQPLGMTRLASKVRLLCAGKATALMMDSKPHNQEQFSGEVRNMAITSVTAEGDTLQFREEGDTSLFMFQRRSVRLKMSKGLKLIMTLLNEPDRDFHVLDLERFRNGDECAGQYVRAADGEPQLDAQAKRSYRARLHELREHLDEARSFNDSHRASLLEEEIAFLARELARAVGLRGSDRKTFSD